MRCLIILRLLGIINVYYWIMVELLTAHKIYIYYSTCKSEGRGHWKGQTQVAVKKRSLILLFSVVATHRIHSWAQNCSTSFSSLLSLLLLVFYQAIVTRLYLFEHLCCSHPSRLTLLYHRRVHMIWFCWLILSSCLCT